MTREEAIFWRTQAGLRAWACADSGLPGHYRQILAAMHGPVTVECLRNTFHGFSCTQLHGWLGELQTLGFIQTAPAAAAYYRNAA